MGAGEFKIKVPADSLSGEGSFLGFQTAIFLLCLPMQKREERSGLFLLFKSTDHNMGSAFMILSNPNYIPKALPPHALALGFHMLTLGHKHSVHSKN